MYVINKYNFINFKNTAVIEEQAPHSGGVPLFPSQGLMDGKKGWLLDLEVAPVLCALCASEFSL